MKPITTSTLSQTLQILSDNEFHDGTSIGAKLNITRAGIWKIIKKSQEYQFNIEAVKHKGYRLVTPFTLLNENKIQEQLNTQDMQLHLFESIDSTNHYFKTFNLNNKIHVCLAEMQTAGIGRFQREWHSPFGQNIYLSMGIPCYKDISELSGLSLVVGLAICDALTQHANLAHPLFIKWPNDILCADKKLAGSLIEVQAQTHTMCQLIIGIGINVNMQHDSCHVIKQPWTSLIKVTKPTKKSGYDRNILCAAIINALMNNLQLFFQHGLDYFLSSWHKKDYLYHKKINLKSFDTIYCGIGSGITQQGHLKLKLNNNAIEHFSSGDTTVLRE